MSALAKIAVFTAVETVVLAVWLILAGLPFKGHYGAIVVLFVGLFVEHALSLNAGTGKPFFSIPK